MRSPLHGSSPAQFVCRGAQRGISLAAGTFTGEARRKPLGGSSARKCHHFSGLYNHDFGLLDSFGKSTKSSLPNPPGQIHLAKSSPPDTFKTALRPKTGGLPGRAKWLVNQPTGHGSVSVALICSQVKARKAASSVPASNVTIGSTGAATAERENADGAIATVFAPLRRVACGLTLALPPTMIRR